MSHVDVTLIIIIIILLWHICQNKYENFSMTRQPLEQDNTLLNRNPYDHSNYQVPYFIKSY